MFIPQTPFYLYREDILKKNFAAFKKFCMAPVGLHTHFALKANTNPHVLNFFREQGLGIDVVSGGEIKIGLKNKFLGEQMVFSGVGKSDEELLLALNENVYMINVESAAELATLRELCAQYQKKTRIALRLNPDVDAKTHPYISTGLKNHKFGIDFEDAEKLYLEAVKDNNLFVEGVSIHIGSQMLDMSALEEALEKIFIFAKRLKAQGVPLKILDVGGGLGVSYHKPNELPPFEAYGAVLENAIKAWKNIVGPDGEICCECGRALVATCGMLVTKVISVKESRRKNFAIVDASMTELLRPALYQAEHPVFLLDENLNIQDAAAGKRSQLYDIVGPVCESSDTLRENMSLSELHKNDILALGHAGAYGYVMSSHYNARPMPAEYFLPSEATEVVLSRPPVPSPL